MPALPTLLFALWCLALSACDLRCRRLPNALTLPGAAFVLGYGFATGRPALALSGAVLLAVPYLLVHLCSPHALGAGDVKLALGLGATTALAGPQTWCWAALAAPMLTAAAGLGSLLAAHPSLSPPSPLSPPSAQPRGDARARWTSSGPAVAAGTLAHGPAMCAASVVAVLAGR
ncbi:prepilin peptidase [Nocardia niigatensis]